MKDINEILNLDKNELIEELKEIKTQTIINKEFHKSLAEKLENFGEIELAIKEYNLSLRDGEEDNEVIKKVAEYYYVIGNLKNSSKLYEKLIERGEDDFDLVLKLGSIYEEMDKLDKTKELYLSMYEKTKNNKFKNLLKNIEENYFQLDTEIDETKINDDVILKFIDLFSAREGVYAKQWANNKGESGYTPIRNEHFSYKVAKNHLLGNYTVGLYQLRIDSTVRWGAFDIDITKKYWKRIENGELDKSVFISETFNIAKIIKKKLEEYGINSYIEYSGFKGYHCWLFFEKPIPAFQVRVFLLNILKSIEYDNKKFNVEIFPKQTKLKGDDLGNLIKLPLGIHKKSGELSVFVDQEGNAFENQYAFLQKIEKIKKDYFFEVVKKLRKDVLKKDSKSKKDDINIEEVIKETDEFDPYTSKEFNYLISKCEVLAYLVNKAIKTKQLTNDEKIIIKFTFGNIVKGKEIVNYIFTQLVDYDENDLLKSSLNGNPISCAKIRKRLKGQTQYFDCSCDFGDVASYPNPLLHLRELFLGENPDLTKQEAKALRFQNVLQEYLKIKNEINEREKNLKEIEKYFHKYMNDNELEEVSTSIGVLKRIVHPDGRSEFIIKI